MISPKFRQSSSGWSVVNPSVTRRAIRRVTGSLSDGDSIGFSAFSSCILFDQTNQVLEFKRFAHEVIGPAAFGLRRDIDVTGNYDVGNGLRFRLRAQRRAKCAAS